MLGSLKTMSTTAIGEGAWSLPRVDDWRWGGPVASASGCRSFPPPVGACSGGTVLLLAGCRNSSRSTLLSGVAWDARGAWARLSPR